ncbi:MAG: acetyl-coenzyme A synthetase N-terminal domain-containing protein [Candidatus Nezhaarchaeales archaeon]
MYLMEYMEVYEASIRDPEKFWDAEARKLEWFRTWDKVLEWDPPFAKWFVGGVLNASYLCVDHHVKGWRRNKVAMYWEGEPGDSRTISYAELHREVNRCASVLKNLGFKNVDYV